MIRTLPLALVREIAAGEVIDAPADAVRELLENALDAGADRIDVALWRGGKARIVVRDNGHGIPPEQLEIAFEAHSTSKLPHDAGLAAVRTLGFRGEALHALRRAARVRLLSRPEGRLGGAWIEVAGDEVTRGEAPTPAGTEVTVTDLYARLPARRAALGSDAGEARACQAVVTRRLLHHPGLRLRFSVDGELRLAHAGGDRLAAVKLLWGEVTANRLLPFDSVTTPSASVDAETAAPPIRVRGLLGRPELTRARRDRLLLAVNGRPVAWPEPLLRALLRAYRELLPSGRYPVAIVDLELPSEALVLNTAPDKGSVRLLDPSTAAELLRRSVEGALARHPLAPALPQPRASGLTAAAERGAADGDDRPGHGLPALRHIGRYRDLYLLAEGGDDLWVVDQHAAHERILFEELEARYRREPPLELDEPELLPLTPDEEAHYRERRDELAEIGLTLEAFGPARWRVRTVPAFLAGRPELVADAVRGALGDTPVEEAWRATLGRLACLPAFKAGHPLENAEAQALLDALLRCRAPWTCPHGRPTALVLSELELARRFGRRGVRATATRSASDARTALEGATER